MTRIPPAARRPGARCLAALAVLSLLAATASAAAAPPEAEETGYRLPPQVLVDLVDAPPTPRIELTPDREALLVIEQPSLPSIASLAEPELRLAGLRINPRTDGRSRTRPASGLRLVRLADGADRRIEGLGTAPRIEHLAFSPSGSHLAFTVTTDDRIELWTADLAAARASRLIDMALHLAVGQGPVWLDDRHLLVLAVPEDRGAPPVAPRVPSGPVVRESLGERAQARTYQDLLANPHDEALFAHHLRAQLLRVGLDGRVRALGEPALYGEIASSPDGRYILVEALHRPFSYLVPAWRFPHRIAVLDRDGQLVREIADVPLQEAVPIPFGSVPTGPRSVSWRADAPATLVWAEALDGGDAGRDAELRDRLYVLAAPFEGVAAAWTDLALRLRDIAWGRNDLALVRTFWWQTRTERLERLEPGDLEAPSRLVVERSFEDRYGDPGRPVKTTGPLGREVLLTDPERPSAVYLIGNGASPEGERPFIDRFDLDQGSSERLFRSQAPSYEQPVAPLADGRLLTRRESVDQPPNYFVRSLGVRSLGEGTDNRDDGDLRAVTDFPHPTPQLTGLSKELITYRREDGVELSATLYLPPGYDHERDGPLPLLMWAYPIEYKSADAAGQITDSPYRFDRISWRSPVLWTAAGFAVLDGPKMPIVGEGEVEPNDTFRRQLVASARAAADEVVRRGIADRHRLAIGGHSYGAFMTANLLAHSDIFAAGIARSGAYNRTLTPFGFQAEQRTYWQAPEVYYTMSPFMHADKVDEPILLIHGDADNNSGTFPIQSERFYHALKGHGATVRLVMLPHESHAYRARESILHMLYESHAWLARYVAAAEPRRPPAVEGVDTRRGDR